jgi:zinc transporter 1/2/3
MDADHDHSLDGAVELDHCSGHAVEHDYMNLRIAAIFIILIGATGGALFPVLARRSKWLHVPKSVFECVAPRSFYLSVH